MVRFAMIGAGSHAAQSIYPALHFTDLQLVAVADLDRDRAHSVGSRFGAPRIYTDFEKMLEVEELDAVGVVGPPTLHQEAGIAVLESGRHLFVEKPPAPDLAGARRLQEVAGNRKVRVMVGFMKRHATVYRRAKEISQRAEFGRRTVLRLNYSHVNYRPLRDHITFMAVHALDLARHFMGDVIGGSVIKRNLDGNFVIALLAQHGDGGISQITLSAHEPRVQESLEIAGESALVQVRNLTDLRYHPSAPGWDDVLSTDETMTSMWFPEFTVPIEGTSSHVLQGYAGELHHFGCAVMNDTEMSASIADGIEAMRLAEALFGAPEGVADLVLPD